MQEINTEIHLKKKKNKKREYNMSEKKKQTSKLKEYQKITVMLKKAENRNLIEKCMNISITNF